LAAIYPDVVERLVAMGAGDDPPTETPGNSSYSAESLMAEYGDHFEKRVAHMPEPERWAESLEMLNELYNSSSVSKETFEKIRCPVLVMAGDGVIPGCGHVILYCNYPAVWESMRIFLGYGDE
jgi:pimeloyl-ACP methyl ester carboxylesterase